MSRLIAVAVLRQALLIGDELFPVDIAGVGAFEAHWPFAQGDLHGRAVGAGFPPTGLLPPAAINVGAGIGRILQNTADPGGIRLLPDDIMRRWSEHGTDR